MDDGCFLNDVQVARWSLSRLLHLPYMSNAFGRVCGYFHVNVHCKKAPGSKSRRSAQKRVLHTAQEEALHTDALNTRDALNTAHTAVAF
jgi:hypothetical protein